MWDQWFATDWMTVGGVMLSAVCVYLLIVIYVRLTGLRSLSKMTAPDFAMTVAVGSLFASSISTASPTVLTAAVALAALFAGQAAFAVLMRSEAASEVLTNCPRLLYYKGEFRRDAMRECLVTEDDLRGKLREANALRLDGVHAVVFESTGDVSVLHGGDGVDEWLLKGIEGADGG